MSPGARARPVLLLLPLLAVPLLWGLGAGDHALGHRSVDLLGHLWHHWHAAREPLTTTTLVRFPEGVDLRPITGGWLDVWLGGRLGARLGMGPVAVWNTVVAVFVAVAGLGGTALARVLGAGPGAAVLAGLLLQLDGFLLLHLAGGRTEQVGIGFVALALAGGIRLQRDESSAAEAIAVGISGALVVALGWELALGTAAGCLLLAPVLLRWGPQGRAARRRTALALATAALLCLPGVVSFLAGALAAREASPGFRQAVTAVASVGLLEWLGPHRAGPHSLSLLALLALPWTAAPGQRRLWAGLGGLLGLSLLLALGPTPALHRGGPPVWTGPTLWDLAHAVPILDWFHWPDRLTVPWSLLAPVAAALAVTAARRRAGRAAAVLLGLLLLGGALAEHAAAQRGPPAAWRPQPRPSATWLRDQPGSGAVFDLPLNGRGHMSQSHLVDQLTHGRPTRAHPFLDHLVVSPADPAALPLRDNTALRWLSAVHPRSPRPAGPLDPAALAGLGAAGFDWIVLHETALPAPLAAELSAALAAALGPPVHRTAGAAIWSFDPRG